MLTDEEILSISKIPDAPIQKLLEEYSTFIKSPYYNTYITLYNQVADWNSQLTINENDGTGVINIFADKDTKSFDRAFKYLSEVTTILAALDTIRGKMSPQELKESEGAISKKMKEKHKDKVIV